MKVLKFGGTSVGTAERIKHVAQLGLKEGQNIMVLSAMSGTTNSLVEISQYLYKGNIPAARELLNALEAKYDSVVDALLVTIGAKAEAHRAIERSWDIIRAFFNRAERRPDFTKDNENEILAQGELISTALMFAHIRELGHNAAMLPALSFMRTFDNGEPDMAYLREKLPIILNQQPNADIFITQGFICRDSSGKISNLKRGGSDYTASLIGAAIDADEIQIWTDIDGMHNNDPRYVDGTKPVSRLHFEEAAELAYFGAKILHPTCVLPAKLHNIPIRLLNTLDPSAEGTLICNTAPDGTIKAIAAKDGVIAIKIKSGRMLMAYGFLNKIFEIFKEHRTSIDMIATSEVGVTLTIDNESHLPQIVDELKNFGTVTVDKEMVIVCVVGDLEWHNTGFEARAIAALQDIPIRMISYGGSNYNISMLVHKDDKVRALRSLSEYLFSDK